MSVHFDDHYRNRIRVAVMKAVFEASRDPTAGVARLRTGEVIDALLTAMAIDYAQRDDAAAVIAVIKGRIAQDLSLHERAFPQSRCIEGALFHLNLDNPGPWQILCVKAPRRLHL